MRGEDSTRAGAKPGPVERGFFTLGNLAIDDLVYADGTTRWNVPGGGALYAALGTALWTSSCAVIAPLGFDYPIAAAAGRLDVRGCRPAVAAMRNWGLYEEDGSRHFLARRATSDWSAFSPHPDELGAGPYSYCHLAPMPWTRVSALVATLRDRGARVISVDLHDRELAAVDHAALAALLRGVDVFFPSRQDIEAILPTSEPAAALRRLRTLSPATPVLGVKCGADGAIVHQAGAHEYLRVPSAAIEVVDATGAGDAFCGGFLAGWGQGCDVAESAARAAVSASFALATVGPAGLATAAPAAAESRSQAVRLRIERHRFAV